MAYRDITQFDFKKSASPIINTWSLYVSSINLLLLNPFRYAQYKRTTNAVWVNAACASTTP